MIMSVAWGMPSKWTFQIPAISAFIQRHITSDMVIVDPFCGSSLIATHRNDLANGGVDAAQYCRTLQLSGLVADAVLFDPPYSPRQISECYKSVGLTPTRLDTQNAALYSRVRQPLSAILRPGGIALSFGWQSSGFSRKCFETIEILLVQHGGAHNDTICVAQVKSESV